MTNIISSTNPKLYTGFLQNFCKQNLLEDIINVAIYDADIDTFGEKVNTINSIDQIKYFLDDLLKSINKNRKLTTLNNIPIQLVKTWISTARRVLELRNNTTSTILNYDNISEVFTNLDPSTLNLFKNVSTNRINSVDQYKTKINDLLNIIQLSKECDSSSNICIELDQFTNDLNNNQNFHPAEYISRFYKIINEAHAKISTFTSMAATESLSNSITIGGPDYDPKDIANNIITYLSKGYAYYKSGYEIIDSCIGGIESASLHLICGPSNNAKSILMINLLKNIGLYNAQEFEPNDMMLYITLEDDIYKLIRRFGSVLGNLDNSVLKHLYISTADLLKNKDLQEEREKGTLQPILDLNANFINMALNKTIGEKAPYVLKHFREPITPDTVRQIIEYYKRLGKRVRVCFIDYMDCMAPSNSRYTSYDDYNSQGIISQELRNIAQEYLMPVITITQAVRGTENTDFMTSDNIGDSIKKVRYSDYIYMIRMKRNAQILDDDIKKDIIRESELQATSASTAFTSMQNQNNTKLVPFELKITKAKDGDRDMMRYHVFSGHNLRIYNYLSDYYSDVQPMQNNSSLLTAEIERARMNVRSSIGALTSENDLLI